MDILIWVLLGFVAALALMLVWTRRMGFQAQTPADYAGQGPEFDIREHLNGDIICEGVIYGPMGRVVSRFVADFHASWQGNVGRMTENFRYDSGATQRRAWTLTLSDDGHIQAEADDVVGLGTGMQTGAGVQLRYRIRLDEDAGGHVLDTTDWMYLVENGTIINRSQFRKFGIKVGELVAVMRPKEARSEQIRDAA